MSGQWKLVPVDPTETMVINGFESVPNECFTDDEVWEQYQEMSGCQQAAFRAKLCWAAMLGSAPSAPTNGPIEVVAVINEEGTIFKETVVEHRPGIELLPVGTELVDIAHVIRLTAERDALQQRLNAADQRIDELTPRLSDHLEGKRERFQKWVMATKHPVFGFLDGRSLARGDDRTGYADEYVQGLWVAYLVFGAFASRDDSIAWLKRIDGIGQNRAELIYSMGFRRLAD